MSKKKISLSVEDAEQLWGEIENEGFGYWVLHYGYDGDNEELKALSEKARKHLKKLNNVIQAIWDEHEIG